VVPISTQKSTTGNVLIAHSERNIIASRRFVEKMEQIPMRKSILVNRLLAQLQAHATATNTSILRGTRTAMRKLIVVVLPAHSQNYTAVIRRSLENRRPTTMRKSIPVNRLLAQLQAHTTARSTSILRSMRIAMRRLIEVVLPAQPQRNPAVSSYSIEKRKQKTMQRLMADVLLAQLQRAITGIRRFVENLMQKRMDDFMLGRVLLAQSQRNTTA
jgi:hypothetical protein